MSSISRFALIGSNIENSKAPITHQLFSRQFDIELEYNKIDTDSNLSMHLDGLKNNGYTGANITAPFKVAALSYVDKLSETAKAAGAINTIKFEIDGTCHGHNTDGLGFITDILQNLKWQLKDKRILILGAGGAVRGILPNIMSCLPKQVIIANRKLEKTRILTNNFPTVTTTSYDSLASSEPFDLIINGTSASLSNTLPLLPKVLITPETHCYDLAYMKQKTIFCQWAGSLDCKYISDGLGMSVEQAAMGFEFWFGLKPDTKRLYASISMTD